MIKAKYSDKELVVDLLTKAFDTNKSVNYVVKNDDKRVKRIKKLMEYSFDMCYRFGEVFLSEDKQACALTLLPDRKKTSLKTFLLNLKLTFFTIGVARLKKVMERERAIKSNYPTEPIYYLWFIAVSPDVQSKGYGKKMLAKIIERSTELKRPVYLETSMVQNLDFYKKHGFEIYKEIDQPMKLFLIRRNIPSH